jgi:hypothetical protein
MGKEQVVVERSCRVVKRAIRRFSAGTVLFEKRNATKIKAVERRQKSGLALA